MLLGYDLLQYACFVFRWIILIQIIMSWLISFNVINTYNAAVRGIYDALGAVTEPLYRPIRKILPDFGGLDFSPFILLTLIYVLQAIVLPDVFAPLLRASYAP